VYGLECGSCSDTEFERRRQTAVKTKRELVETSISGMNHAFRFEPGIVVRTTVFWNVPRQWFGPQKSGPDQKFPVRTTKEWSGPDKVVQTGEKWYFQNYQKTSSCWFRPLFLVQTGKTWSIPSFSRLLSYVLIFNYFIIRCSGWNYYFN
jgi:hypothetical protein